jgi:bifunctional non-homologous end joining protein LigD
MVFAMGLSEYRGKRNFKVTNEPRGGQQKSSSGLSFVVQKHSASHLHYDLRLELNGILLSWAVPKGPSLDPADKRLAMQVEDHPIEYGDFEGIIPEGEYGGGTVLLWDKGTWEPVDDAKKAYRDGALKFTLHGEKLKGKWMLVRKGGRRSGPDERHWFLFKERDEYSKPGFDIAAKKPLSVSTGRDLDEIAESADRVWGNDGKVKPRRSKARKGTAGNAGQNGRAIIPTPRKSFGAAASIGTRVRSTLSRALKTTAARKAPFPRNPRVQLATLAKEAPDGDAWIHEIKFDGYRMLCRIHDGKARFVSRNGKDWTSRFPALGDAAIELSVENAILDGEVVIQDDEGRTSFQLMQNAFQNGKSAQFLYYVFDLLYVNGHDLRDAAIEDRKKVLKEIIPDTLEHPFKFSDHVLGNGPKVFAEAARMRLEGIVSKKLGKPYSAGRGMDWLKVKCSLQEEFVIGGFTKPSGSRTHFGALLLGYYEDEGELTYAGRVGTGFNDRNLSTLYGKFKSITRP